MEQTRKVIENVIQEILDQKAFRKPEIKDESRIIDDLGFSSLDIAQLVAHLEMELGVDPFAQGALISKISTVGVLCDVYQFCLEQKDKNVEAL